MTTYTIFSREWPNKLGTVEARTWAEACAKAIRLWGKDAYWCAAPYTRPVRIKGSK